MSTSCRRISYKYRQNNVNIQLMYCAFLILTLQLNVHNRLQNKIQWNNRYIGQRLGVLFK